MNVANVISELKQTYPDKNVIIQQSAGFLEILVELEPTHHHKERSTALAIVGKSKPHFHKISTEVYEVTKGELTVYIDGEKHMLKQGEKITVLPNHIHYAEGDGAWFLTYSTPGWTIKDHIVI